MKRPPKVSDRPAEYAAPAVFGSLTALLIAFGVDPARASAIAGFAAAAAPGIVTYLRGRGWL